MCVYNFPSELLPSEGQGAEGEREKPAERLGSVIVMRIATRALWLRFPLTA